MQAVQTEAFAKAITDFILQASRTSSTDKVVTEPRWSSLDEGDMKFIRTVLASLLTVGGMAPLIKWGLEGFPWFISDWGALFAVITQLTLAGAHFRDYDAAYDKFAKTLFELAFPLEITINILYWTSYYEGGMWDLGDLQTYYYPFLLHLFPLLILSVEWIFNSIVWNKKETAWMSLYLILAYLPLTYFAKWVVDYFPYSFVDYTDYNTPMWLFILTALNMGVYYGIANLSNKIKTGSGLSPSDYMNKIPSDFSNLMKFAGI